MVAGLVLELVNADLGARGLGDDLRRDADLGQRGCVGGDVVTVDKLPGEVGSSITLPALLVVDGDRVISDPAEVGRYEVTADIVGDAAGPKINMIQYRNKTGYRRRLGHRQRYTQVRITGIGTETEPETKPQSKAKAEED